MDAREALELRRQQIMERLSPESIQIQPGYFTVREEILRPDRVETETAYFWNHWVPRLGPSAAVLVARMRQACRRAGSAMEKDAAVTLSYGEIARFCGLSVSTVKRLLQQEEVLRFIRKEAQMRESVIGKVDAPNRYIVMMTDPLLPEDEEQLRRKLADRLLTQELLQSPASPRSHSIPESLSRPAQNEPLTRVQSGPVTPVQNELVAEVQNNPVAEARNDPAPLRKKPSIMKGRRDREPVTASVEALLPTMQNVRTSNKENVNNVSNGFPYIDTERIEEWALRLVEVAGDDKSLRFYRKAVRILLQRKAEGVLDHAIGRVKEAIREGKARKPGALLTSSLLTLAEERGIYITERGQKEAAEVRQLVRQNLLP
jgi:hypothetical protein